MPHTKSAKKALRQTARRNTRNRAAKKAIKLQIKKFQTVAVEGTPEQKLVEFKAAVKKLDKAAAKRKIHPNTVARRKSQLARALNAAAPKKV
jgi:small subunit ribosomal protein S20